MVKTKIQKVLGLIPTFVEGTGKELVGGFFAPPPSGAFHFVEMQSVFFLYLQNGLEFLN